MEISLFTLALLVWRPASTSHSLCILHIHGQITHGGTSTYRRSTTTHQTHLAGQKNMSYVWLSTRNSTATQRYSIRRTYEGTLK